jgi:type I restriction enzyme S subunit
MRNGWTNKLLSDICEISSALVDPREQAYQELPHVGGANIESATGRLIALQTAKDEGLISGKFLFDERTVLYSKIRPYLMKVARPEFKGLCSADIYPLVPRNGLLDRGFLYYMLLTQHFTDFAIAGSARAGMPKVNREHLFAYSCAVPPLPEQQRIVGILDEAFEGIATAKANAEKNLQNARALFESHLQSVFTRRGEGWDRLTLGELLDRGWIESHLDGNHGGDYPRKEEFISEGVPYISANCLDDERVDMARAKYLSPSRAALLRKGIAKDNDVLFAHNATVGPVAILRTDEEKVILGTSLTYYRCNPNHILPEYLAHYMRSFGFKTQYLQVMRQSTRNQVPITKQREFWHVIPPIEEQERIIGALDGLLENGQRLAAIYERKLAALEELKKSLLDQAFTGQL